MKPNFIPLFAFLGLSMSACFLPLSTQNNVDDVYSRKLPERNSDVVSNQENYYQENSITNSTQYRQVYFQENTTYIVKNGKLIQYQCPCDIKTNDTALWKKDSTSVKDTGRYYQTTRPVKQEREIRIEERSTRSSTSNSTQRSNSTSNTSTTTTPNKSNSSNPKPKSNYTPPVPPNRTPPPPAPTSPSKPQPRP